MCVGLVSTTKLNMCVGLVSRQQSSKDVASFSTNRLISSNNKLHSW
jgi:hypothetical protein